MSKGDLARFATLIANALRTRGFAALRKRTSLFAAATTGTLTAQIHARSGGRRTLIATARHNFTSPGSSRLQLRLTRKGKRLLRRAKRLDVEIRTRFAPATGAAVSASRRQKVTRRGQAAARATRRSISNSGSGGPVVLRFG